MNSFISRMPVTRLVLILKKVACVIMELLVLAVLFFLLSQGDVYSYKHALVMSQYEVEDLPGRDKERVSALETPFKYSLVMSQCEAEDTPV